MFLNENPWCNLALMRGEFEPATEVDHIIPHRGNRELFWDQNNWQSICKKEHSAKTMRGE